MNPYLGLPLETIAEALTLAQAALPVLARGEAVGSISTGVGSISTGDQRISFVPTTTAALIQDIAYLQAAIAAATGNGTRRRGVYITGGKGL